MTVTHPAHRGSILVEDAVVRSQEEWSGGQYVLTLTAPGIAARATPGAFVHLTCDPNLPMRRPLSLQRVDRSAGTIEILYKVVGEGTRRLASARVGDTLSCMGPIGNGFSIIEGRTHALLLGGGVGLPPMVFLAEYLSAGSGVRPLAFLGSEIPFPFTTAPSTLSVPGISQQVSHAHPLLEARGIPSRLTSGAGFVGCHKGFVTDLATEWLRSLSTENLSQVAIYACGPTPMLRSVARVAAEFHLPAQVSLEEYMACAVGGCAGCAVPVTTADGTYMRRVCVDGPVFDARQVFPEFN
jgi:dihydroorotate dehydrogenase electron transfer subunit